MTEKTHIGSSSKHFPRSFRPLILFHERPSKALPSENYANVQCDRMAIHHHRNKTNAMLEQNSYCFQRSSFGYSEIEESIKVSPSTSTASNISTSSSSSSTTYEESIKTVSDVCSPPQGPESDFWPSNKPSYPSLSYRPHMAYSLTSAISTDRVDRPDASTTIKQMAIKPTKTTAQLHSTTIPAINTKKRRRGNLPKEVTEFLRDWLIRHKRHPYPAEKEKAELARRTGLTVSQISNWFINARRRILQPMLESEHLTAQLSSPYSYATGLGVSYGIANHDYTATRPHTNCLDPYSDSTIHDHRKQSLHAIYSSHQRLPPLQIFQNEGAPNNTYAL